MISESTEYLLAYGYLKGIGKVFLNELAILAEQSGMTVADSFNKLNRLHSMDELKLASARAKEQIETARNSGHKIISRLDDEYPDILKSIHDAPPLLFCYGDLALLKQDIITIIGTRSPTEHGAIITEKVTNWFTGRNWVVASGLAKGIDAVAHKSCLDSKGKTIAVLAHGLEKVYPAENKLLAKNIIANKGLLITEYGYNSYVGKSNFVERDRIQAALAKAVVLVQSDKTGGSLHASKAILNYGRFLIVLGQSRQDIKAKEPKISANLILMNGTVSEKLELLKLKNNNLEKLLILPDKRYYEVVNSMVKSQPVKEFSLLKGTNNELF